MATLTKKEKNAEKKQRMLEREQKREKLTNWYMINLSYGILALIALMILRQMYKTTATLVYMQTVTWILTGVFALGAIAVFALGRTGVIKNTSRANNYTIFLGFCALGSLWLALYNKIRPVAENVLVAITGNKNMAINSHWNIRVLFFAVILYLILAFVWYLVKLYKTK